MAYIDFYHYSSEDAIDAIIKDGIINESPDGGSDAHFGGASEMGGIEVRDVENTGRTYPFVTNPFGNAKIFENVIQKGNFSMATSLTYQDGNYAPFQLKITSNEDMQQFMKAIHADFLGKVDAFETGLIDSLISCGVLTDSDTESLDGKDVRTTRDRARKLYLILEKLPVGVFVSRVGPVLCSKFPHIIPVNFQTEVGELAGAMETDEKERGNCCLRCSITRCLRVSTIADLLYGDGRLETLTYKEITANCYEDHWKKLFQAFENPKMEVTEKLTNGVREVLQRHSIAIPENLPVSLKHGLPCECSNILLSQKNSLSTIKVMAWQQVDESAPSVLVALGNMLSDQTPLGLRSDGEEADDEDSSTHYPGSEKTFSSRDEDFENESLPSSSDVLSPNYIWDRQQRMLEVSEELPEEVYENIYYYTNSTGGIFINAIGCFKEGNFSQGLGVEMNFYHYTNRSGAKAIKASMIIKETPSYSMFAHHGQGVYGTSMEPRRGKVAIARNNWRSGWNNRIRSGRLDYAIRVTLPREKVVKCYAGGRDIYVHKGPIHLSDYSWEVIAVDDELADLFSGLYL